MATQYTNILKLALPVQGELSGTWGDVVNDNITEMVEEAIAGRKVINTWTANSHTLTTADGTTSESRAAILTLTDTGTSLTGAGTVICPANSKVYIVENGAGQTITVKTSSGTGVAVPNGENMVVFCDGTNVEQGITNINNLNVTGTATIDGAVTVNGAGINLDDAYSLSWGDGSAQVRGSGSSEAIDLRTASTTRLNIDADGDLSLYNSAGTSQDLFWDASASRLGLGTTSPGHELHIKSASPQIRLDDSGGTNTYGDLQYNGVSLNVISRGGASAYGAITFARTDGTDTFNTAQINAAGDYRFFDDTGTEGMRWDASASRLGLGTTAPNHLLDVQAATDPSIRVRSTGTASTDDALMRIEVGGTTASSYIMFGDADDSAPGRIRYVHSDDSMRIYAGGAVEKLRFTSNQTLFYNGTTEVARFNSSNNFGIGTNSPSYDLSVVGSSAAIQVDNTAGSPDQILAIFQADMGTNDRGLQIKSPLTDSASDFFRFSTGNSIAFEIDGVNALSIASNKLIGINQDVPNAYLDIGANGNHLKLTNTSAEGAGSANYNINMASYYAEEAFSIYQGDSYRARTWIGFDNYGQEMTFGSGGAQRMVIDESGNVGIGDSDPIDKLTVSRLGNNWTGVTPNGNTAALFHPGTTNATSGAILTIAANASSASSIYFSSLTDNDVGFIAYDHSDNSMQFRTNGVERLRVTSAGRVGIGTSVPETNLHVHSTGNTLAQISSSFNGSLTTGLYIDTTGDTSKARLAFQKGGATVGVLGYNHASSATNEGYTFSTSLGTRALLQGDGLRLYNTSGGVSHFFTYNENGGEIQLLDEAGNVGTLIDEVSTASRFLQLINGSAVQVGLGSSNTTGNLQFIGGGSEWARFTSAGRLGIASTNPQAKVHAVADSAYGPAFYAQNDGSAASWARMDFYNDQASNTGIIYRDQSGNFIFRNDNSSGTATTTSIIGGNTTAGHITFNTTVSSEAMRVESSGEVGIGTATPSAKLHVYHGTSNSIIKAQSNNGYAALQVVASGSNSSYIFFNNGNQETGRIQSANGGIMVFYTNATQERMRIQSTGVLRLERSLAEHSTALSGSGTVQINYRLGNNFTHTLSGNTTYTFVTPEASGYVSAITLKVTQDSTARTITWPSSVDWAGGTAPTLSTGSGDVDVFVFVTYDGGTTYYGFTAGQDMS